LLWPSGPPTGPTDPSPTSPGPTSSSPTGPWRAQPPPHTWPQEPNAPPQWPAPSSQPGDAGLKPVMPTAAPFVVEPGQRGARGPGADSPGARGPGQWLPPKVLAWLLPGLLAALVLSSIGVAIGEGLTGSSSSAVTDLLGEAGLWAAMFGTAFLVSRRYGTGRLRQDFGLAWTRKDVLWAALAAVSALIVSELVVEAFAGTKFSGSNTQIITQQQGHEVGLVLVGLLVAVGAPFFEELFFRGYLRIACQQALKQLFGESRPNLSAHGGVWLQAVLFGFAHFGEASKLSGNLSVVSAMFGVGLVLGYTARLTGRLGAGMLAHGAFNVLALISVL
jgi:CAAX protease family protein